MDNLPKDFYPGPIDGAKGLELHIQALENFFEDEFMCVVVVDKNGCITMMNEAYADFLGTKRENVLGRHVTEIIDNTRLHIVVETGKEEIDQIQSIRGFEAVTSRIPIIENHKVIGAIGKVMFKDIQQIKALYKNLEVAKAETIFRDELTKNTDSNFVLNKIVGENSRIVELKATIIRVACFDSTVLITGESGTGKECIANAIHEMSNRKNHNFVKINCAAIPENILESELFGYENGAFTGAKQGGKIGKFELAHMGTIFLDEIGDMSTTMQTKILRVLQEKEIEKIGGNERKKIDIRIIAATNQNLIKKMETGEFREDLFYRLNVVSLEIPPLRERLDDVKLLSRFFINKFNKRFDAYIEKIDEAAMVCLETYTWPGNVREFENVIERAYSYVDGSVIRKEHLPRQIAAIGSESASAGLYNMVDEYEKQTIIQMLESCDGNKSKVAKILGVNRANLYKKLKKYHIDTF